MGVRILVRILGPVEAELAGEPVALGPPKQRAVLAVLVLRPGRPTAVAHLVDALWPAAPPRSALKNLQLYVHQLRKLLPGGLTFGNGAYRLDPGAYRLDADEFDARVTVARRLAAGGDLAAARDAYHDALLWWRGPALADLVGRGLLCGEAAALDQGRLRAIGESVETVLRLGGHEDLLPRLARLVADHPLHERFREQQVRALQAAGRHAEAVAAYREAERVLADDLGVPPGPALRALVPGLRRPAVAAPARVSRPVPAELPADIPDFTGRHEQVADAVAFLGRPPAAAMRIWALSGTAGVGKSCLAVHVAHRLRPHFPDGQLHVGLHGQGAHRVDPADVLARFLRALGMTDQQLPVEFDERIRCYRSRLADRRVLVVLDDATDEQQVRPLLPGGPGCAAVVTSRIPLAGLAGARALHLDVLDREQAVELLAAAAGPARVAAEPAAAGAIVELCGRLPLAVRVASARLAARSHWSLNRFADRLADGRRRLDELRVGDLDVRASFQLSYDGLEPAARRAFHLLALLDQPTVTGWLAAALLDAAPADAEDTLDQLVDAQLLQPAGGDRDRYRTHDLLRVYAAEQAAVAEQAGDRAAALDRALAAWVAAAERSAAALTGAAGAGRFGAEARRWFAREQTDVVAALGQAHRTGRWEVTWRLARALTMFLAERSQWSAWQVTHELAQDAAYRAGNADVAADLAERLGDLYRDRGRFDRAETYFRRSLELAETTGSPVRRAYALRGLGDARWGHGDAEGAVGRYVEALPLFEAAGEHQGSAHALRGLSVAYRGLGRLDEALDVARRSVGAFRALGDRSGETYARRTLGGIHLDLGHLDEAEECFLHCHAGFERLGDRLGMAAALLGLGMAQVEQGRHDEARETYHRCRETFAEVADPLGEAYARRGLGDALTGSGRLDEAHTELAAALAVFVAHADPRWEAYARTSLGTLFLARGEPAAAREHLGRALAIFDRMGARVWSARARELLARAGADGAGPPPG